MTPFEIECYAFIFSNYLFIMLVFSVKKKEKKLERPIFLRIKKI